MGLEPLQCADQSELGCPVRVVSADDEAILLSRIFEFMKGGYSCPFFSLERQWRCAHHPRPRPRPRRNLELNLEQDGINGSSADAWTCRQDRAMSQSRPLARTSE